MNVLVLNCGASTATLQLIETDRGRIARDADYRLARGVIERVGGPGLITGTAEAAGRTGTQSQARADHHAPSRQRLLGVRHP